MRILVNYSKKDQSHLPILQYHLKNKNLQAIATNLTLSTGELVAKAKSSGCTAILLCNEDTLNNCVPGAKPTLDSFRGSLLNFSIPTIVTNSLLHTTSIDHGSWLLNKDLDKLKRRLLMRMQKFLRVGILSLHVLLTLVCFLMVLIKLMSFLS